MIEIEDKKDCCGCHACVTICARNCITMQLDDEGFLYPVVNKDTCTDCGLCERVCPFLNQRESRRPLKVYAAKNKNEEILMKSSSGGIFSLLAEAVINEGGFVFGAKFDKEWNVVHDWTNNIEGITPFRGSKYVQSTIGNTYQEAKNFLNQGKKVLFSGTPCQIAGLKNFLRKEYDNLLTLDMVCHGVPSPLIWRQYLEHKRKQIGGKNSVITDISFRDKKQSWQKYSLRLSINDTIFYERASVNSYLVGFGKDLYLRTSCHYCSVRGGRSHSDITIGDFWGIQNYYSDISINQGVSLVFLNSHKALEVYNTIRPYLQDIESSYEKGLKSNPSIERSSVLTPYRNKFWELYKKKGIKAISIMIRLIKYNYPLRIYKKVKSILLKK